MSQPDHNSRHLESFLAALPDNHRHPRDPRGLGRQLAALYANAANKRAAFTVASDVFLPFLAARIPLDRPLTETLKQLCIDDLYLSCACTEGIGAAINVFEAELEPTMDRALAAMRTMEGAADDIKQRVRTKTLLAHGDRPPKISQYSGKGDLRGWIRAVTIREALTALRANKTRQQAIHDSRLDRIPDPAGDPETAYLKSTHKAAFTAAFSNALESLAPGDRTLLRYKYCDDATIDDISVIYGIHRATAARRLARIREVLWERTRDAMRDALGLATGEFESVLRVIQSQLEITIRRHLEPASPTTPS